MADIAIIPLPSPSARNILVTSALPYVNNYPHLGNIIGAVLSADVYSRYARQRSYNVIYVCGTDEYGTATETKAQQERLTPRQICDKYHALHREVYEWFDISFDIFGRTSTEAHTSIVQSVFQKVHENGFITEDTITQLYCDKVCHRFLADRYVNGDCPHCGFDDARGDQCDNCGRMLNPAELLRPRCSTCGNEPISRSTTHLFLDLPKLQPRLEKWVDETSKKGNWTNNALRMTQTWLNDQLKVRCITRDLKWGVPVPLEGFTDKVFYVWFDAPLGYPSITAGLCGDDWKKWWLPDEGVDIKLVQFMGKDNVPFHTIVFPGALIATADAWTMLHHISTTDYLNYENGKFSKSRGIGVFGNDAIETGIPSEVWRYYLLLNRPEGSDAVFTWDDLAVKNNDELIKTLGNFINRVVTFLYKSFNGVVPGLIADDEEDNQFTKTVNEELSNYKRLMDDVSLKAGLKKAMAIASIGNQYLQRKAPWNLIKEGKRALAGSALTYGANLVILVTIVLEPFLGTKFSVKVFSQLGLQYEAGLNNLIPERFEALHWLKAGMKTCKPQILFSTLTQDQVSEFRNRFSGDSANARSKQNADDEKVFGLDLRVGQVVEVKEHEDSERLFVSKVNVGESEARTIVAGLRGVYTGEELKGRKVVVVCNLKRANLAGVESQGMMLVAEKKKATKLLAVDEDACIGARITADGVATRESEELLDRKGFQAASKLLRVGQGGDIVFDKTHRLVVEGSEAAGVRSQGVPEGGKVK
ncbi:putative methionine--tRNA ligase [Gracilariopsis chorda]|uniref:methionine--tRNA ligase n=1 Tax=Gracilariopsis chorda TaxID=448386 RepID=A0A2V3IJS3_9FLOR|nr:putative methionine--tRNA ligase [Gracilariopsis chorda]|eukprot:PXF42327.1 putative methionine--tRNA ligase [Gracilariopsis chorda]